MKTAKCWLLILLVVLIYACENGNDPDRPGSLSLVFEIQHVSIHGGNDGEIHTRVTGGVPPYIFNWAHGSDQADLYYLTAGLYYLMLADSDGNTLSDTARVTHPDPLMLQIRIQHCSSSQTSDGAIDVTISGGLAPYSIYWSTGDTTEDISGLSPGEYIITIVDMNNAQESDTVEVGGEPAVCRDSDGNEYDIVQIGSQVWMKKNIRVTHAPDRREILSYCYDDDTSMAGIYGRLYTWDVAMNGADADGAQGICPDGWHIPADEEWKQLEIYLGMSRTEADMENIWRGTDQGTKLILGGSSGYDALLGGRRSSSGAYALLDRYEYIWTSTEFGDYAWRRCLCAGSAGVGRWNTFPKTYAFSVRCIKDE